MKPAKSKAPESKSPEKTKPSSPGIAQMAKLLQARVQTPSKAKVK
jgi:hypothetical protein